MNKDIERIKVEYEIAEIEFKDFDYKKTNFLEFKEKIKQLEDKANEEVKVVEGLRIEDLKVSFFADPETSEIILLSLVGTRLETDQLPLG